MARNQLPFALTLVAMLCLIGVAFVYLFPYCTVHPIAHALSPLELRVASLTKVDCTDRERPALRLNIRPADSKTRYSLILSDATTTDVELRWQDVKTLEVWHPPSLILDSTPTQVGGILVIFREKGA